MKGVGGAIRKAVEVAFAKAAEIPDLPRSRAALDALAQRTFVPGLVRIDDAAAAPKRRVALRRQLPQEALPLIDCLVDQRLLVTDTAGTEPTVEVSHEAVLRHWRELEAWIAERRDDLSLSERVTAAARDWRAAEASREGRGARASWRAAAEQPRSSCCGTTCAGRWATTASPTLPPAGTRRRARRPPRPHSGGGSAGSVSGSAGWSRRPRWSPCSVRRWS